MPAAAPAHTDRAVSRRSRDPGERSRLLDAARRVLSRAGLDGLTVAAVLAEAGLSTRAYYRHFSSHDELVLAVYEREQERASDRLHRALDEAGDPPGALEAWVDHVLSLGFDARLRRRTEVMAAEAGRLRPRFRAEFEQILDRVVEPLRALLVRGRDAGDFPETDPAVDARALHAAVWDLVERRLADPSLSRVETRAIALHLCRRTLGAP